LRRRFALAAAVLGGLVSFAWFAARPAMPVLAGMQPLALTVPAHYQAAVFPAFGAFIATVAFDAADRGSPLRERLVLALVTSALALLRLLAIVPLSGHAFFCAALFAHDLCAPRTVRTPFGLTLAGASLGVTAWYKLFAWADGWWLLASTAAGAAVGAICAWPRRERFGALWHRE
jgi:hypothetical protein